MGDGFVGVAGGICLLIAGWIGARMLRHRRRSEAVFVTVVENHVHMREGVASWTPVFRIEDGAHAGREVTAQSRLSTRHPEGKRVRGRYDAAAGVVHTWHTARSDGMTALAFMVMGGALIAGSVFLS